MPSVTTHDFIDIRVYDGSVPPNYITVTQYGFTTLPGARAIPATEPIAGGMKVAPNNIATIIRDQMPMLAPIEWTLTLNIEQDRLWQLDAFANPRRRTVWGIGTDDPQLVWTPVHGSTIGTVENIFGEQVPLPPPIHANHIKYLVNLEVRLRLPLNAPTGSVYVHRLLGCASNGYDFVMQQGELQYTLNMVCFGQVDGNATEFTAGTETT